MHSKKWVVVPVPMEVFMKKYGLIFITYLVATYVLFVVLKFGETFTKDIHVLILSIILVTLHWMVDSFNTPTKQKR